MERHRTVIDSVSDEVAAIHAFSVKAWTPAQFEKKKAAGKVPQAQ